MRGQKGRVRESWKRDWEGKAQETRARMRNKTVCKVREDQTLERRAHEYPMTKGQQSKRNGQAREEHKTQERKAQGDQAHEHKA